MRQKGEIGTEEAARRLNVTRATVHSYYARGWITGRKEQRGMRSRLYLNEKSVERFRRKLERISGDAEMGNGRPTPQRMSAAA